MNVNLQAQDPYILWTQRHLRTIHVREVAYSLAQIVCEICKEKQVKKRLVWAVLSGRKWQIATP